MHLRRRGYLQQNIKCDQNRVSLFRRNPGSIKWITGWFFLLFLLILLCAEIQMAVYRASSLYLEDALAASNLASAVIDIEEYGISHTVRIAEPVEAYERYIRAVKENLQLNENWESVNSTLIGGPVTIEKYVIYNVEENFVRIYDVAVNGRVTETQGTPGRVVAPNGVQVTETGIYSEIAFPVKGFLGINVQAHKGNLVDIVAEEREDEQREGNT